MKNIKTKLVYGIILLAIIIITVPTIFFNDKQVYNNGKCECGGQYQLFDVEKDRKSSWTYYYYKCPNCSKTIETNSNFE